MHFKRAFIKVSQPDENIQHTSVGKLKNITANGRRGQSFSRRRCADPGRTNKLIKTCPVVGFNKRRARLPILCFAPFGNKNKLSPLFRLIGKSSFCRCQYEFVPASMGFSELRNFKKKKIIKLIVFLIMS